MCALNFFFYFHFLFSLTPDIYSGLLQKDSQTIFALWHKVYPFYDIIAFYFSMLSFPLCQYIYLSLVSTRHISMYIYFLGWLNFSKFWKILSRLLSLKPTQPYDPMHSKLIFITRFTVLTLYKRVLMFTNHLWCNVSRKNALNVFVTNSKIMKYTITLTYLRIRINKIYRYKFVSSFVKFRWMFAHCFHHHYPRWF